MFWTDHRYISYYIEHSFSIDCPKVDAGNTLETWIPGENIIEQLKTQSCIGLGVAVGSCNLAIICTCRKLKPAKTRKNIPDDWLRFHQGCMWVCLNTEGIHNLVFLKTSFNYFIACKACTATFSSAIPTIQWPWGFEMGWIRHVQVVWGSSLCPSFLEQMYESMFCKPGAAGCFWHDMWPRKPAQLFTRCTPLDLNLFKNRMNCKPNCLIITECWRYKTIYVPCHNPSLQ